jgi:8-oxo-dGTP pyrophosphatase MutT (NUDIX family)
VEDYKEISHSAGGIVVNKNRICLVREKEFEEERWFLPKGKIEKGEDSLSTAKREVWEETGLKELEIIKKLGIVKRPNIIIPEQLKIIDIFLFKTIQEQLESKEEDKEPRWFDINEAVNKLYTKEEREFVKEHEEEIGEVMK